MSVRAIARPYAKALFMLAQEQNEVEAWSNWLALAENVSKHPHTVEMLKNPVYTKTFRVDFFLKLTHDVMPTLTIEKKLKDFLWILSEQDRVTLLPEINEAFEEIKRKTESSTKVEVTSAKPLTATEQENLVKALSRRFSTSIELQTKEDPSLMAGVVIRAQDIVLDGSVLGKIRQLKEALA